MNTEHPRGGQRVAVIGDVAGHLDELQSELVRLGADARTGALPPDLTVVQVGDLVHRGPDSDGVVRRVDRYLTEQPTQWIQLVGNHEVQYLRDPAFVWADRIGPRAQDALRRWWADGRMRVAVAVDTTAASYLITHAGLTAGFWRKALGAPGTAHEASRALNGLAGARDNVLFRPGQMLSGRVTHQAGPIWAAAATELLPSWRGVPLPFSQVHGHATVYDWRDHCFRVGDDIARATVVDEEAKHETTVLPGGQIVGVDPGHGRQPRRPWRAWVITASVPGPR